MASNPTLITTPFAQSGDKTPPPNTNTPSDGRFSQTLGFPPVTAIPLSSGGKAPKREDFNGAFNMLSNIAFYAQKGWVFEWDSGQSYYAGCIVRYSGNLYACTSDVTSTTNSGSDTTHWSKYNISPGVTYAPINSPAFTGTPTAPTPTSGDDSTKIATTAFVKAAISGGGTGVTDAYYNSSNGDWYRVYSDKWIEQGGIVTTPSTGDKSNQVTVLKPMADTNYSIMTTRGNAGTYSQYAVDTKANSTTQITVTWKVAVASMIVYWMVIGKGA